MARKKRPVRRTHRKPAQQLAQVRPSSDPHLCPMCKEPFALIVGCHKVCRCGYEEGCGD